MEAVRVPMDMEKGLPAPAAVREANTAVELDKRWCDRSHWAEPGREAEDAGAREE